jgi:hypothetical protein
MLEKRSGTALTAFLPPIFAGIASVSWCRVSPLPPRENVLGSLYIGFLGQPRQFEINTFCMGATRLKQASMARGPCHLVSFGPRRDTRVLLFLMLVPREK